MEYITIGEILRPQGIRGEVKVRAITDDSLRFAKLKMVYIDNKPYRILQCRIGQDSVILRLSDVTDRNAAELLRGKLIDIDRVNAVNIPEDTFFIADLIGCRVVDEENSDLGEIVDIAKYGAADVITVRQASGKEMRFPFLNKLTVQINTEQKTFRVRKKLLDEVCVYDD